MTDHDSSFWLVIVTRPDGRQFEVTPSADNRKTARAMADSFKKQGLAAFVVQRQEWEAAA